MKPRTDQLRFRLVELAPAGSQPSYAAPSGAVAHRGREHDRFHPLAMDGAVSARLVALPAAPDSFPFLIGILLAYLGDPLVDRLERHRLSRTGGVVVVFALFALILLILLLVLVPMLGRQLVRLYQLAPEMLDWLQGTALPWSQSHLGLQDDLLQVDQLKQVFTDNIGKTTDVLKAVLAQATSSGLALLAWLGNLMLIPVVSFYLMRDWMCWSSRCGACCRVNARGWWSSWQANAMRCSAPSCVASYW